MGSSLVAPLRNPRSRRNLMNRLLLLLASALLASCAFCPPQAPPPVCAPAAFKEGSGNWKTAEPGDGAPRGDWWSVFEDAQLDGLLRGVEVSNQSLQAAAARAEGAAALLQSSRLAFLPTINASASLTRNKSGALGGASNANALNVRTPGVRDIQSVSFSSNWELDLWGRLSHSARAATADHQALVADSWSLLLSLQASAARTYFELRAAGAEEAVLKRQEASLATSLQLTRNREAQGIASGSDVALAETQLATTQAALQEVALRRSTLEHALATLVGCAPAAFHLAPGDLAGRVPRIPAALPSTLLERRPDISAAERRVAAANERIGVAKAAFFPVFNLSADTGWRALADGGLAALFTEANNFWALGADAALAILNSGRRIAAKKQAEAAWREEVANYRQTALTAFQETEDALATLRILAQEGRIQAEAVRAAQESVRIAGNQYEAGTLDYLNVVVAQTALLNAERAAVDIQARRLTAMVALVTALGGSWEGVEPVPVPCRVAAVKPGTVGRRPPAQGGVSGGAAE